MNADVKPLRTTAETALGDGVCRAPGDAAGWQDRQEARRRICALRAYRAADTARRAMEIYRLAALDARCKAARAGSGRCGKAKVKTAGQILSGVATHRLVFVDGTFVPELSEQEAIPGVRIYSLASEA